MKSSDRWVGKPVYKLEMDSYGHEIQIRDGVPVNEIEDHVPLQQQLPVRTHHSKKRHAEDYIKSAEREAATPPFKRNKILKNEPPVTIPAASVQPDKMEIVSCFVQDTLWTLTSVLDVSDDKQRSLFTALDNRNEQPLAALARYAEEGGLDALSKTLRAYVCGGGRNGKGYYSVNRASSLPVRDAKGESVPRRVAMRSSASPRIASRCDQHLRDLLSGNIVSVFSPKSTLPKEPHALYKQEPEARGSLYVQPNTAAR